MATPDRLILVGTRAGPRELRVKGRPQGQVSSHRMVGTARTMLRVGKDPRVPGWYQGQAKLPERSTSLDLKQGEDSLKKKEREGLSR